VLAQVLVGRGKLDEAERVALQAREIVGPQDHGSRATTRMALGLVRAAQGRDAEAEKLLREAVDAFAQSGLRYAELQALAEARGSWQALRPSVLGRLEHERQYALLTEIHLRDDEVAQALAAVKQASPGSFPYAYAYGGEPLPIRVAQAAERDYPREAIALYSAAAERLIRGHGRDNYAVAARYLARVRDLYQRLGEGAMWDTLITDIRAQNRRLRALKEELDRAGL
jgi:ATP/maltotriose-dependent transcriptional regulator MalT